MAGVVKLEDYMKDPDVYGLLYDEPTPEEEIREIKEFAMEQGMEKAWNNKLGNQLLSYIKMEHLTNWLLIYWTLPKNN